MKAKEVYPLPFTDEELKVLIDKLNYAASELKITPKQLAYIIAQKNY